MTKNKPDIKAEETEKIVKKLINFDPTTEDQTIQENNYLQDPQQESVSSEPINFVISIKGKSRSPSSLLKKILESSDHELTEVLFTKV